MIHTDEDDEFARIEHENAMRQGQPYHWDVYVSPSQRNQVLEEAAKVCEEMRTYIGKNNAVTQSSAQDCATAIRAMKK